MTTTTPTAAAAATTTTAAAATTTTATTTTTTTTTFRQQHFAVFCGVLLGFAIDTLLIARRCICAEQTAVVFRIRVVAVLAFSTCNLILNNAFDQLFF